ncbi:MAG: hypothetical protein LKM36_00045 [Flavobacteriales bacterium]|nr:hypothetical protein [Flavobacteriales bacterium]
MHNVPPLAEGQRLSDDLQQGAVSPRRSFLSLGNEPLSIEEKLDPGIRPAVKLLWEHGFDTIESCQGGEGHCFKHPTIYFFGDEFDAIRAHEICQGAGMIVSSVKRVFRKTDPNLTGLPDNYPERYIWERPFNEIVFVVHSKTGTIYRPGSGPRSPDTMDGHPTR